MNGNIKYYNTRKKGYYRDQEIKRSLEIFELLTVEQLSLLHFFESIKDWNQALVKTRERLRSLRKLGVINGRKIDVYGKPYGFYINKKIRDVNFEHVVNRNWACIYIDKLNSYFKLENVKMEYVFDSLVADGFCRLYSEKGNRYSYWFVESDRSDSRNKFTKVQQYNDMYEKDEWVNEYWNDDSRFRPEHFPKIMVVTDSMKKADLILECVSKENRCGLEFYVITVDEIKKRLIGLG